ncbi:kinesin light chain [Clonorchis sinensis]|uniref:Kinesin light chain n=1 Tax=Clonorchis sinensis TaxID=79923 RepID=G7YDH0_CLOSI|nr:kinesin light chain [Clonorchis sinensis]
MPLNVKRDLKNAQLILESLKRDHEQALVALNTFCSTQDVKHPSGDRLSLEAEKTYNQEKIPLLKSALSRIQNGLDDSEASFVLFTFAKYVDCLEAENMKLALHNQRLREETSWLRDELKFTQSKLAEKESLLAQTVVEKRHLEFMMELNKYNLQSGINGIAGENDERASNFSKMSASSIGLSGLPKDLTLSPEPSDRTQVNYSTVSPRTSTPILGLGASMTSSFLDGDLAAISCTQSYHPYLIGSFHQNSPTASLVPPRLRTLHRIVMQYTNQGKFEVAASLCLQAISDLEKAGGRDQTEVAVLLNMLALVYRAQGKYAEAAELLQDVVAIRERLFGPNHPLVAASLNNLAVLYAKAARFSDAEPLCRRALAVREKASHRLKYVAKQLNNLALLCQSQGRFDEVEMSFRKALDIYLKHHKPSSPIVLRAKSNLASALLKRGNLSDAEILLKAVLSPVGGRPQPNLSPSASNSFTNSCEEADSAVFSLSSTGSTYSAADKFDLGNGHPARRVVPIWLLVEQAGREGRDQLSKLMKFDLSAWAAEAHIELRLSLNVEYSPLIRKRLANFCDRKTKDYDVVLGEYYFEAIDGRFFFVPAINTKTLYASQMIHDPYLRGVMISGKCHNQLLPFPRHSSRFTSMSIHHANRPIVVSALRNLAIVYQRQGLLPQANLLRTWLQPTNVNGTMPTNHQVVTDARSDVIRDLSISMPPSPQITHQRSVFACAVTAQYVLYILPLNRDLFRAIIFLPILKQDSVQSLRSVPSVDYDTIDATVDLTYNSLKYVRSYLWHLGKSGKNCSSWKYYQQGECVPLRSASGAVNRMRADLVALNQRISTRRYSSKTNGPLGLQRYKPKEQTGSHMGQSHVHKVGHKWPDDLKAKWVKCNQATTFCSFIQQENRDISGHITSFSSNRLTCATRLFSSTPSGCVNRSCSLV